MVDIVVPTFNQAHLTERCFGSIRENTDRDFYRLIWVDDGSLPMERERILSTYDLDRDLMFFTEKNFGFTHAVNIGIASGKSPLIVLLNNDVVLTKHWLFKMCWHMEDEPRLGVLGVVTNNISGICSEQNLQKRLGLLSPVDWNMLLPRMEVISVTGYQKMSSASINISYFCTMFRRKLVKEIGFLNEAKHPLLGSDNEYNARARNAGWLTGVAVNVFVEHDHHGTLRMLPEWNKGVYK